MGILRNLVNAKVSGNVGSMNFRKRGSQTVVAERSYSNSSKGNGASLLQRTHRSRLANIVNFFRAIRAIEARAWQVKPENNSDFNMFSKYNLAASPIFLSKAESVANACVVAPYEVSRGSLETLQQSFASAKFNCGVFVGGGLDLTQNTLGTISQTIIDNNPGWLNGDKLSVALLSNAYADVAGVSVPKVDVVYVEITLDVASNINFMQVPSVASGAPSVNGLGYLTFDRTCNAAFAIHSRKVAGILETSSQLVIMASDDDPIFAKYSSAAQKEYAMSSYGYQSDVLLTPDNVNEINPADVKIAVLTSATYDGSPIADGGSIQGGKALVLNGNDFTAANIAVTLNGVKFVPQIATSTKQQFTPSAAGTLTIAVNGVVRYTLTCSAAPSGVQSFKLGTSTYTAAQSNQSHAGAETIQLEVFGSELGELSATGVSLSSIAGDATHRTAVVYFNNANFNYTISCGSMVLVTGANTYVASGGGQTTGTVKLSIYKNTSLGGTVSEGGSYPVGTEVTIEATPNEGYLFDMWNDRVSDNPRTLTLTANKSLTAWFYKVGDPRPSENQG